PGASETGFWRVKPNNVLEVLISHNTGITEGWVGQFDGPKIQLVMDQGYSSPSAKIVTAGVRLYGLVAGELFFAYDMAAEGKELQAHIWSSLPRSND
ncbi:MAG: FABP family protein, partial [Actinobacteria bacterium]|nr:FABP family protein [Actinomycetota bacterium]